MRSPRGIFAAVVFLSLLPVAIVYQIFFENGLEIVIHFLLATGSIFIALAVFDFKTPRWMMGIMLITWAASVSTGALAVIFLLQAIALIVQNDQLIYLAFQLLGQRLESTLGLPLIFWCIAMLLTDSRGKTWVFGLFVMSAVACYQVYFYGLTYFGAAPMEELKLVLLLMFVWLLFESAKKNISRPGSNILPPVSTPQ
ncbi:MAG TPA: hypothetical protein VGO50_00410 [Pyrinomonadaceae bacterium]|jgi:hypothetical protein|nr:hypothetical protein [Pyrinomonadaceae bacterium]